MQRPSNGAARQQVVADAQQLPGAEPQGMRDERVDSGAPATTAVASDPMEEVEEGGHGLAEGAAEGDGVEPPPSADALKEEWQQEQKLLELLVQRGYAAEHPVRVAAQRQVEAAHKAWTGASPGVAVTQRLLWADKALQRAR